MYRVLSIYHSNLLSMQDYLQGCKTYIQTYEPEVVFDIGNELNADYVHYMNSNRYPVFIMYKQGVPFTRLIGKVTTQELHTWIKSNFV